MQEQAKLYRHPATLLPTGPDIEGPFYRAGAPVVPQLTEKPTLALWGYVTDAESHPIPLVTLDIWQADERGEYDMVGWKFRGKVVSGRDGSWSIGTVHPGCYQISESPPDFRCSHVHFKLWQGGKVVLTTQLYFPGEQYDDTDHWFDQRRCVTWTDARKATARYDFVLRRE